MTSTCRNLSSAIVDIPRAPVRLQDIPRKTLRIYGIIFDDDDDSEEEDEGALIIDESVNKPPEPAPAVPQLKSICNTKAKIVDNFCTICRTYLIDTEQHRLEHCPQSGCPDWIPNPVAMAHHQRNHNNHPTKPFACQWCKKRYRFHLNMLKHHKLCKSYKKSQKKSSPALKMSLMYNI